MCVLVPVVWNFTKEIPLNYADYYCWSLYTTMWLHELSHKSVKVYHFGGPWVRIQARTENMSIIFFVQTFSHSFIWIHFSHNIWGVHKQCRLSKGRGRGCLAAYVIIQFEVSGTLKRRAQPKITIRDHIVAQLAE